VDGAGPAGPIRLVVTDLDGTFWGRDFTVPPAHVAAVAELSARGVTVLAATSRRPRVVGQALGDAGLTLPAVLLDGALGLDFRTGVRFHVGAFPPASAAAVLRAFRHDGLDPCLYVDDPEVDVIVSARPSTCAAHLDYIAPFTRTADLTETASSSVVLGFCLLGRPRAALEATSARLHELGVTCVLYPEPVYGEHGLLVSAPGISKWAGIVAFCHRHGVGLDQVLAVGDGENDVSMLSRAAVAVAVEGGSEAALRLADHVIAPPERDGWAHVVSIVAATLPGP
jgi:hydroxymethylpyrimidine pyrophosphatase-like HAD family hydrolase